MPNLLKHAVKLAISGCLIVLLYRNTSLDTIGSMFASIEFIYLPAIILILCLNTLISSMKWQQFLRADGVDISLLDLTISYMSGTFCNLFLPSSIGGDSYRIYDVARRSRESARAAASVFADRFSGFIALVSLSLISSFYVARAFGSLEFVAVPLVLACLFVVLLSAIVRQKPLLRLLAFSRLDRIEPISRLSRKLFLSFACYGADRGMIVRVMLLSFAFQFLLIFAVYLMACALHAEVAFFYFSAFVPLITLMEALPISIYGIGVRDYGYVLFFTQAGMTDIETRSLALLYMAVTVSYSLIGGLFFMYKLWFTPGRRPVADSSVRAPLSGPREGDKDKEIP